MVHIYGRGDGIIDCSPYLSKATGPIINSRVIMLWCSVTTKSCTSKAKWSRIWARYYYLVSAITCGGYFGSTDDPRIPKPFCTISVFSRACKLNFFNFDRLKFFATSANLRIQGQTIYLDSSNLCTFCCTITVPPVSFGTAYIIITKCIKRPVLFPIN